MFTPRTMLAREIAARGETGVIVTVLCDSADKYLSEHFWDEVMIRIESEPWRDMVAHAQADLSQRMLRRHARHHRRRQQSRPRTRCALENVFAGAQAARYELRPEDLLRADRAARERKLDLIGIYHSHPDCDAYFSETDLKNSCPWYSFVVLSIQKGDSTTPIAGCPTPSRPKRRKRS